MKPILALPFAFVLLCCRDQAGNPAQAPEPMAEEFNLDCVGKTYFDKKKVVDSKNTLRISLADRTWCYEDCKHVYEIVAVEPGKLRLSVPDAKGEGNDLSINRVTGKLYGHLLVSEYQMDSIDIATCTRAPYTGRPKVRF